MALCRLLPWDSDFFGLRIATVDGRTLTPERSREVQRWCADEAIDCAYFLADADDYETSRTAAALGFHLADVRLRFQRGVTPAEVAPVGKGFDIRPSTPSDVSELEAIARITHTSTRFFFDTHFPRAKAEALYETWIARSCEGWADAVLVAVVDGRPSGYISVHKGDEIEPNRIGLLGVAESARGRGLGGSLVQAAAAWFGQQGEERLTVVTQGRNLEAQRLYQRCGFVTESIALWYHRWRSEEAP